ncbi:MAG: tetratricopeptide repeat protein [Burkholderiales bacterium]|nr:tetratricopeptide repeat protein [Burkholderiales bacterium]MDE1928797.1 tetratricopeptide repeat protein [Burkholderiales bacterium]MDE2158161.1 tetratricopeptide repeat protein [Burkholderiales bacterium]MDE2504889.1 tetratricopeptide repeat protein [Burkholderiales bacterium]
MAGPLSFEAPTALDYFAALVADDASFSVLEAALAVAQDDEPELDVQGVLAQVDELAERLRRRLPADAAPLQRLRLLNQYFFNELGFSGNVNDYYDSANSSLAAVLRTRRGIPLTLALIYIEIATQAGLRAHGVAFPGHFLVKLHMPRGEVVIDPFSGRSLGRDELEDLLLPYRRESGLVGDDEAPLGLFLQTAPAREIIARLLRNLKEIHGSARDWPRLRAVLQRLVILLPEDWDERRDHALVLGRLGRRADAARELAQYLAHRGDAADAPELRRQLAAWRAS